MLRILLASLLTLAAFAALTPTASATCIDATPDDNGVGSNGCNVPVAGPVHCKVLVYGQLPGVSSGCSPIVCVRECVPYDCVQDCDGPADSLTQQASLALPCTYDLNALDDNGVGGRCNVGTVTCTFRALSSLDVPQTPRCDPGFIDCVTEPCHYPYPIQ